MSEEQLRGVDLPARTVPVPHTISPEARAFLSTMAAMPVMAAPAPDDLEGWRAQIAQGGAMTEAVLLKVGERHPAEISSHALSRCTLYELLPSSYCADDADCCVYYVHGGGYTVGGGIAAAYSGYGVAGVSGLRTFCPDYRMPPDFPYPAALDDAVEGYRFVLERYAPEKVSIAGGSAGAGLAAACILKARDIGLPLPGAALLLTPEADLTESGDTFETNYMVDVVLKQRLTNSILLYANGHDLADPYLSPLFGDFSNGFPPTLLTAGTRDMFLSNAARFHRALRAAEIETELHVWEAMPHGGFFGTREDEESLDEQRRFLIRNLGIRGAAQ